MRAPQAQRRSQPLLAPSPTPSTFRANPYPEVKDPICRFPLPTFIYRLEAVHLGDLMRLSVRSGGRSRRGPHLGFQGPTRTHGRRANATLFGRLTLSLRSGIPGSYLPYTEKKTLPGVPASFPRPIRVAATDNKGPTLPRPGSLMRKGFPFALATSSRGSKKHRLRNTGFRSTLVLWCHFRLGLGPTDPCPTTVHMEPFPTSGLKDLSRVFATTTKICAIGRSRQAHAQTLRRDRCDLPTHRRVSDDHRGSPSSAIGGPV